MDSPPQVAWREGVRLYLGLYARIHLAPSSRRRMTIVLEQFGTHLAGMPEVLYLSDIGRTHIERYQLQRIEAGKSPATVNADVRHLRAFLRRAKLEGWTPIVATDGVKLLRVPKKHHSKIRSPEEVQLIHKAFVKLQLHFWAQFLLVVANTGIRLGEALALRTKDVVSGKLRIRVEDGFMTKDREERFVPLNPIALMALRRRTLAVGRNPDALLFPSRKGTPIDQANARKFLKLAVKEARVPHTTWHSLRHTFASVTAAKMPEQALMTICGWGDSRTANQHYIHRRMMDLPPPPTVIGE